MVARLNTYKNLIESDQSILLHANLGVKVKLFLDIAHFLGLSKEKLATDVYEVSIKTINRYQKEGKLLSSRQSELSLRLLDMTKKGLEIFGTLNSFQSWMRKPCFGLGNAVPIKIINTGIGIDLIKEELIRIEFGALA